MLCRKVNLFIKADKNLSAEPIILVYFREKTMTKHTRLSSSIALPLLFLAVFLFTGCASQTGGSFSSSQARTANTVLMGTITQLNSAVIDNNASGVGAIGGAVAGGVAGSTVGGGRGRTLATLGGALAGAAAGHAIENRINTRNALEITVRLDNGQILSTVQELGDEERSFNVGDRVRVLRGSDGSTRVRR